MGTLLTTYAIDVQGTIVDAIGKVDTKNPMSQILIIRTVLTKG